MNQKIDTMKKLIYIAFISAATLTACSDDFLERPPLNSVSEDTFWQSEEDVYLAVNALYADLPADGLIYEDGATDIAHAQNPWESTATDVSSGVVNTTLDAGWSYIDKRKANYFLDNVDKAEMSETLKER
ncbi:RagB/SusD family nutrient uptake outer membrane protein, partial [Klebsiella pneumoniae]